MKWEFKNNLTEGVYEDYIESNITGVKFQKEIIDKQELKFQTLREVVFQNVKFISVTFNNVFLAKVKFINCEFLNVNIVESNFNKVVFANCKLTNVSFFQNSINEILINESIVQLSKFENEDISNGKFDDVKFKENLYRHNKIINTEFYKCDLIKEMFIDTIFKKCNLKTSHLEEVNINIDDLVGSTLSVLNMIELISGKGIILED